MSFADDVMQAEMHA